MLDPLPPFVTLVSCTRQTATAGDHPPPIRSEPVGDVFSPRLEVSQPLSRRVQGQSAQGSAWRSFRLPSTEAGATTSPGLGPGKEGKLCVFQKANKCGKLYGLVRKWWEEKIANRVLQLQYFVC